MITLIDYGAGNLASLEGALARLGRTSRRSNTPEAASADEGLWILPGVGHFASAARALQASGFWEALPKAAERGRPLLGICLGLQLLSEGSEEAPGVPGLGLLRGTARRLGPGVLVPHMGWSPVDLGAAGDPVWLYFVHSFALEPTTDTLATAEHGRAFTALARHGRVAGIQAHPEKSGPGGLALLESLIASLEAAA